MPCTGLWALPWVFWSLTSTWVVAEAGEFQLRSSPLPIAGYGLKLSGRGVVDGAAGSLGWAVGVGKHRVAHRLLSRGAATEPWPVAGEHLLDEGLCGHQPVALRLRGGGLLRNPEKINKVRKMSRTSGLGRKGRVWVAPVKIKKKQPTHNLPPAGWREKIKRPELQKKDVSTKGAARGRTKPTYHFWTKTKIKTYIAKTRAYRVHVKKQIDAKPIRNYNRGEHRHQWKWLPSAYEKQLEDEEAAKNAPAKKSKKKARKKDKDGDEEEMDDNDEEGEDGEEEDEEEAGEEEEKAEGGGDAVEEEEEEFMFPGMDGDDSEF